MKKLFILLLLVVVAPVHADDVQWSKGFTVNCTNPTLREDGTTLLSSEIGSIKYFIFRDGQTTDPEHTHISIGACKAAFIDTKSNLTTGVKDIYAVTVDTEDRESDFSQVLTHRIIKSRPKPPSNLR